jgi:hypothetical protein
VAASPAAILLEQLAAARQRGEQFAHAWQPALSEALTTAAPPEREEWAEILSAMVGTWRRAFDRRPADRLERVLYAVATAEDRDEPVPDRPCTRCGSEIPEERGPLARYCSEDCRREAKTESTRHCKRAAA